MRQWRQLGSMIRTAVIAAAGTIACDSTAPERPPTQLMLQGQVPTITAGVALPDLRVSVLNEVGQTVPGAVVTVTLTLNNANGATLEGSTTVVSVNGVVTFSGLRIRKAGTHYSITATAAGLTSVESPAFDVTPAAPAKLAIENQPAAAIAGAKLSSILVRVQDTYGNNVGTATTAITVAITGATGNPEATLAGTLERNAIDGLIYFDDLVIERAGRGYTLTFSATGLTSAVSTGFDVTAGPPSAMAVEVQPTAASAAAQIAPAVRVAVRDQYGNTVTSATSRVTASISTGTGAEGATLGGTVTVDAVAGLASFANLTIARASAGYLLRFTAAGLTDAVSDTFSILPGSAAKLAFVTHPVNVIAGARLASLNVQVQDALGNLVPTSTASVTIEISQGTGPAGATLTGTPTRTAVNGVATFGDLAIRSAGSAFTLTAKAADLTWAPSHAFDVAPATAARLVFTTAPSDVTAGAMVSPAPAVSVQDDYGNVVTGATNAVTVAITAGSGTAGAALSGTATRSAAAGVASFSDLSIDRVGSGYTLTASAAGLAPGTSTGFTVVPGAATQLAFGAQPADVAAGAAIAPFTVVAHDAFGNLVPSYAGNVTVTLAACATGAALGGTGIVAAASGVATFDNVSVDKAGSCTLTATSGTLTATTSAAFTVAPAAAAKLAFTTAPSDVVAGASIAPAVTVAVLDTYGNVVASAVADVSVALTTGSGPTGATLAGVTTRAPASGVAMFDDLSVDKAGGGYTLTATATGLTAAVSGAFAVATGPAARVAVITQPASAVSGDIVSPAPVVEVQDALGNALTTPFDITVAITSGTGTPGALLGGTLTRTTSAGTATYSDLTIDKAGAGYTLTFTSGALTLATTNAFAVTAGAPAALAFSQQPVNVGAGLTMAAVRVVVRDAAGNLVDTSTAGVTIGITAGTGDAGATLSGTLTRAAVAGVATFDDLAVDRMAAAYTLTASSAGLAAATSGAFDVTPGAPARVTITTQPSASSTAGAAFSVGVAVLDGYGNVVAGSTPDIAIAITSGTGKAGATLGGTLTRATAAGTAGFTDLWVDKAGTGYTLTAGGAGLIPDTTDVFEITAAAAAKLAVVQQPVSGVSTAPITPAVVIQVQDQYGNQVFDALDVTAGITAGTGIAGATLSGTLTRATASGVVTFDDLAIDKAGTGYTLSFTATGLAAGVSEAFVVTSGPPVKLGFTTPPVNGGVGDSLAVIRVSVQDALGNTVDTSVASVTIALTSGTGTAGATLGGTLTREAVAGVATFDDLTLDKLGAGYQLDATAPSLTGATSATFDIGAGHAAQIVFTQQPTNVVSSTAIAPAPAVQVRDQFGNTVTSSHDITVAITSETGTAGATLGGTLTRATTAGTATFDDLQIDKAGTGYTLTVGGAGLPSVTSSAFAVTVGPAARLVISAEPVSAVAGATLGATIAQLVDAGGNLVDTATAPVTIAIVAGTGTPGATLAGTLTQSAVAGVATFADLAITKAGTGYQLVASGGGGLAGDTTAAFAISAADVGQVVFTVQPPPNTAAGTHLAPAPVVEVRDQYGNVRVSHADNVTIAITPGTGRGDATLGGMATVTTSNGAATFSDLFIDRAAQSFTLTASVGAFADTSDALNILGGAPYSFGTRDMPTGGTGGGLLTPALEIAVFDSLGNFAGVPVDVTVAIEAGTGTAGATLNGTLTRSVFGGYTAFSNLSIDSVGTGYRLRFTMPGHVGSVTMNFDVTPGPPVSMAFTTQPVSLTSGATMPAVRVATYDAGGNLAATTATDVTLAIGSGTLGGTSTRTTVAGVAEFTDLVASTTSSSVTNTYFTATAGGVADAQSAGFAVLPAGAVKLMMVAMPGTAPSGAQFTPNPAVQVTDASGLSVALSGLTVTAEITSGAGNLVGSPQVTTDASGVATFTNLKITGAAGLRTITFSAPPLASVSVPIDIVAGTPDWIMAQPGSSVSGTAGEAVAVPPSVRVQDINGNGVGGVAVTFAVTGGGGSVQGGSQVTDASGIATVGAWILGTEPGTNTLSAASGTLGGSPVTFTATGDPMTLVLDQAWTIAGASTGVNRYFRFDVPSGRTSVTFNISGGSGDADLYVRYGALPTTSTWECRPYLGGNSESCQFDNPAAGTWFVMVRAFASYTNVSVWATFPYQGGIPAKLAFTQEPSTAGAGAVFPVIRVAVQDFAGNLVDTATTNVSLQLDGYPYGQLLAGTMSRQAVNGVATFDDLTLTQAGQWKLFATAPFLTSVVSTTFDVSPAAPTQLVLGNQPPSSIQVYSHFGLIVQLRDQYGNASTASPPDVTLSVTPGTGTPGAAVDGIATKSPSSGSAYFEVGVTKPGTGYTLTATGAGLASAVTNAFDVTTASASQLAFAGQATGGTSGAVLAPAFVVHVRDAYGNIVTGERTVSVAIAAGTGTAGAVLTGTTSHLTSIGMVTFDDLVIDRAGTGYRLTATSSGLTDATSGVFTVAASVPTGVAFVTQPQSGAVSAPLSAFTVEVVDAAGNRVTGSTDAVTVALIPNSGDPTATLGGTKTRAAVAGLATFNDITVSRIAAGYRLYATLGTWSDTSNTFDVAVGPAAQIVFTQQPADVVSRGTLAPAPAVQVQDAFGNPVSSTHTLTIAITGGTGAAGATLFGTTTVGTSGGAATFGGLAIDKAGGGYTLTVTGAGLTSATSGAFAVQVGPPAALAFLQQPNSATASASIATTVRVQDIGGNLVDTSTAPVTVAFTAGTGSTGAVLTGTLTQPAIGGVATFTDLATTRAGIGYTLTATAPGLADGVSSPFTINPQAASQIGWIQPPVNMTAGVAPSTPARVWVLDPLGNVTMEPLSITLTLTSGSGTAGATLYGTLTKAASGGFASFDDVWIDKSGANYTFTASAAGMTDQLSSTFTVTPNVADHLSTPTPVITGTGGGRLSSFVVNVNDNYGNVVSTVHEVTASLRPGTGPAGAHLTGTLVRSTVNGTTTFDDLSIDSTGTFIIDWTSGTLQGMNTTLGVTLGAPVRLRFTTQPADITVDQTMPTVRAAIADSGGNVVPLNGTDITLGVTAGTGTPTGTTLGGTVTRTTVSGVAEFTDLTASQAATGLTLTATAAGYAAGTSVAFAVHPGGASKLGITSWPTTSPNRVVFLPNPVIQVQDATGNSVSAAGITVTASLDVGAEILAGTLTAVTNASGAATFTNLKVVGVVGDRLIRFSAPSLTAVSAHVDITPGTATNLTRYAGNSQTGNTREALAIAPAVKVSDPEGNGVAGVNVSFTVTGGGGTVAQPVVASDANGIAAVAWTLGYAAGANALSAGSGTLVGSPVSFTATAVYPTLTPGADYFVGAGASFSSRYFKVVVPDYQSTLQVSINGGSGDADLRVRFGSPTGAIGCSSGAVGNTDACTVSDPAAGDWYVEVYGWSAYTDVWVRASYTPVQYNLTIPNVQVTQAAQTITNTVPLVAGRAALVRVYGIATAANSLTPQVRVRLYRDGSLVQTYMASAGGSQVPTSVDQGTLTSSWNVTIPAGQMTTGLSLLVDIDPADDIAETNEGDNAYPSDLTPFALDVRNVPSLDVTFVPVYQAPNGRTGDVNGGNTESYLDYARRVMPLSGVSADVHAAYAFSGEIGASADSVWGRLLSEINALRVAEASGRHYYGVFQHAPTFTGGTIGLGYYDIPAAIGFDGGTWPADGHTTYRSSTMTHEFGHNFGRQHAPCGVSGDPSYPYGGGDIGVYGWDEAMNSVRAPGTLADYMSYCHPHWTSDYTYDGIMAYRGTSTYSATVASMAGPPQASLLVWGRIAPSGIVLEPAFEITAPPRLPSRSGPYTIEGADESGALMFSVSFDAAEVDHLPGERHFAFVIPLSQMNGLPARLRLLANGRQSVRETQAGAAAVTVAPTFRPLPGGRARLQWGGGAGSAALIRDAASGQVVGIGRDGVAEIRTRASTVRVTVSDGVRSATSSVRATP